MDVLRRDPAATCVITDFDGTLAAIVADPTTARPLPGAVATLTGLCARMGRVAVVSGRPAQFLADHVLPAGPAPENLRLIGLYGLEKVGPDGAVTAVPEAEPWRGAVEDAAARAEAGAPPGARVERKGLSVTLHWREHPEVEGWALATADNLGAALGLALNPARRSVELRPPVDVDKGTAVTALVGGFSAACYLGDDLGDLPAFAALDRMAAAGGSVVKVAAAGEEVPPEVVATADVVVDGPEGALAFLRALSA